MLIAINLHKISIYLPDRWGAVHMSRSDGILKCL